MTAWRRCTTTGASRCANWVAWTRPSPATTRVLALQPDHADAHNNRGNVLRDLQRFAEALGAYDQSLALKPANPPAFNNRGLVLRELGRTAEALNSLDRAIGLNPEYVEAHVNRAGLLLDLRRADEALGRQRPGAAARPRASGRPQGPRSGVRGPAAARRGARVPRPCPGPRAERPRGAEQPGQRPRRSAAGGRGAGLLRPRAGGLSGFGAGAGQSGGVADARQAVRRGHPRPRPGPAIAARPSVCAGRPVVLPDARLRLDEPCDRGARRRRGNRRGPAGRVAVSTVAFCGDPARQLACARVFADDQHPLDVMPGGWGPAGSGPRAPGVCLGRLPRPRHRTLDDRSFRDARSRAVRGLGRLARAGPPEPDARPRHALFRARRRCPSAWRPRAGRDAAAVGHRHRRRPEGLHPGQPARHLRAPRRTDPGELPGLSGHDGPPGHRLPDRRRDGRSARWRSELQRAGGSPAELLPGERPQPPSRRSHAEPHRVRPARARVRVLLVQQQLQDHARRLRHLDASVASDAWQRALVARGQPGGLAEPAPRGCSARYRSGSPRVRCAAAGARSPRGVTAWRISFWTRCLTTRTPRPATRCGRACRW